MARDAGSAGRSDTKFPSGIPRNSGPSMPMFGRGTDNFVGRNINPINTKGMGSSTGRDATPVKRR